MIQQRKLMPLRISSVIVLASLTACGGSGGSSDTLFANSSTSTTYRFVTPSVGAKLTFSETLVDNLNNTINRTVVENVTAVNTDGSFTTFEQDPSGNSITTGAVNHTFYPTTSNYNNSAQATEGITTYPIAANPNPGLIDCAFAPHGSGAPSPLELGQTWTFSYITTCGSNPPVTETQTGTYVGKESITVPAGTFTAYKFQSSLTWTTSTGLTTTETVTRWRNAASSDSRTLKIVANFAYSGTGAVPQGATVTDTRVLQSYQ